jgi:hypothetical protein
MTFMTRKRKTTTAMFKAEGFFAEQALKISQVARPKGATSSIPTKPLNVKKARRTRNNADRFTSSRLL